MEFLKQSPKRLLRSTKIFLHGFPSSGLDTKNYHQLTEYENAVN